MGVPLPSFSVIKRGLSPARLSRSVMPAVGGDVTVRVLQVLRRGTQTGLGPKGDSSLPSLRGPLVDERPPGAVTLTRLTMSSPPVRWCVSGRVTLP